MEQPRLLLAELTRVLARTAPKAPISLRLCLAFTELIAADRTWAGNARHVVALARAEIARRRASA